jgi:hypothetical protein
MIRGGFDKEARRKAQALAADAMSLWRLNQSTPVISYLVRSTKADEARSAIPYTPSMAQSSVRGACGFVLVGKPHLTPQRLTPTTSWTRNLTLARFGHISHTDRFFSLSICGSAD